MVQNNKKVTHLKKTTETNLNELMLLQKANIVERDEINSKYFACLEKKTVQNKTDLISAIKNSFSTSQNEIITDI